MKNNLYEIFSDKWVHKGGTVWIYSDPHFGDMESFEFKKASAGTVYFLGEDDFYFRSTFPDDIKTIEDYNNFIIRRINSKVGKNDTIVFLGDIGDKECIKKIKGYKVLIMGNHDKGASNYKRVIEHITKCPKCGCTKLNSLGNNDGFSLYKTQCKKCGFIGNTFGSDFDGVIDNHLFDEVYEGPLMINDRVILSHEPIPNLPNYLFNIYGHDHFNKEKVSIHSLNVCAEHINYTPINLISSLKNGLLKDVPNIHRTCIDRATKKKRKKELKNIDKKLKALYNK